MKKGFNKKLIYTRLVEAFDSNTHKENWCFSLKNESTESRIYELTEQLWLTLPLAVELNPNDS